MSGTYDYKARVPDPGLYLYHPQLREDYAIELGRYGAIVVKPAYPALWPPVDRQVALTIDDLAVEDGQIAPLSRQHGKYPDLQLHGTGRSDDAGGVIAALRKRDLSR